MHRRSGLAVSCVIMMMTLLCLASTGCAANAEQASGLHPFRELKFYTTSEPHADDAATIHATMRVLNEGEAARTLFLELDPQGEVGFAGARFEQTIAPGSEAACEFTMTPPDGLVSSVITGSVRYDAADAPVDRDLHIAVRGPDPADSSDDNVELITVKAQVVATYAPRNWQRVEAAAASIKAPGRKHIIATDGQSQYDIVLNVDLGDKAMDLAALQADASLAEVRRDLYAAVEDLQRCIKAISGASLSVITVDTRIPGAAGRKRLLLDPTGLQDKNLHPDSYAIATQGNGDVIISARTDDGLRQGIYGFLTDHVDCHWFQPRELGEELPRPADRTVAVGDIEDLQSPSWFSVTGMSWSNAPRWDRRMRTYINRGRMVFGHAWANFLSPNQYPYDEFPDMWARDRDGKVLKKDEGWTSTNFCSTNPQVIEIVAEKINAQLSANPDMIVASLDPNDYGPMCLCDRCIALDKSYGVTQLDGKDVADRLIHFSNQIHERLKPENKDRFLGILIYGYQMELPVSAKPHDHYAAMICNFPPRYDHSRPWNDPTSPWNRDFYRLVKGWGAIVAQFGYYDYYGHYYFFGPYAVVHKMREDLPAFRDLGGTFLMIEAQPNFAMQGLNHYIAARLAWDVEADVDLLLHELYTKYYGPAAEPMRKFWQTAERYYALERPGKRTEMRVGAHEGFWTELSEHLQAAEQAVSKVGADGQRFKDRIAFHRAGYDYGVFHYTFQTNHMSRRGNVIDGEGGLKYLKAHRARIEAMFEKYSASDPYWPTLLPNYFQPDLEKAQAILEASVNGAAP